MQPLIDEWVDPDGHAIDDPCLALYHEEMMRREYIKANNTRRRYNLSSKEYLRYTEACIEYKNKKDMGVSLPKPQPGDFKS